MENIPVKNSQQEGHIRVFHSLSIRVLCGVSVTGPAGGREHLSLKFSSSNIPVQQSLDNLIFTFWFSALLVVPLLGKKKYQCFEVRSDISKLGCTYEYLTRSIMSE